MGTKSFLQPWDKSFKRRFNPKLDVRIENVIADKEGRYILLEVSLYDSTFLLCNIYSPNDNNSQKIFFSRLNDTLREYTDMQIVLGATLIAP